MRVKSEYNPVTNTGHEVCVWNSGDGIGAMLHQDGPEFATLQYASDGVNFEIKGQVQEFIRLQPWNTEYPEAAGLYRPINDDVSPVTGVSWGLCHQLTRAQGKYWMYLKRFESVNKQIIVDDDNNDGIVLSTKDINPVNQLKIYPNPVSNILNINASTLTNYVVDIISINGKTIKREIDKSFDDTIDVSDLNQGFYILKITNMKSNEVFYKNFVKGK
ncbi:hypothetical protein MHTCC0001_31400 [Flavobacteriaceae bacterium MHTCC 0001]